MHQLVWRRPGRCGTLRVLMWQYKTFAAALLLSISTALAVKTQFWTHADEEEFKKGTIHGVVINNRGEIRLARETKSLLPVEEHFDAIPATAVAPDGAVIFGIFPDNKVMRLKDGKLETLADTEDRTITAIFVEADGKVLVGVAGDGGQVLSVAKAGEKPQSIFKKDGVEYVWSIMRSGGKLLLGTGPDAVIYQIDEQGAATELAKLDGENVLSLIEGKDRTLYAGTGEDGLVYRIDAQSHKPFLLYDAPESEVAALALDAEGNLLAATGEDREAPGGEAVTPTEGRPQSKSAASTIPSNPPVAPKEADAPATPGENKPIPNETPEKPEAADGKSAESAESIPEPSDAGTKPTAGGGGAEEAETQGNAVYRIDPKGFTTEIYRGPVVIYTMVVQDETILIGTGDEGKVIEINPATEETAVLIQTEAAQVNAILKSSTGDLILATSNAGQIRSMSSGYAAEGSYESQILDAETAASFGTMQLRGQLPDGTSLTVATRSGNSSDPEKVGWSEWSSPEPAREYLSITTPAARYMQYKLMLKTSDPKKSPGVDEIVAAYAKPNVAPRIASVTVGSANDAQNPGNHTVTWEASDANEDTLEYSVWARAVGRAGWVELGKELTASPFTWPAKQAVDGRYEVKVVASDATGNQPGEGQTASRVSSVVTIDNTPPVIGDIAVTPADDAINVTLRAVDRTGTVASVDYSVDSATHWQRRLPDDTMADSPEERYTIAIKGLAAGQHTLTVRATDQHGNASFENIGLTVP